MPEKVLEGDDDALDFFIFEEDPNEIPNSWIVASIWPSPFHGWLSLSFPVSVNLFFSNQQNRSPPNKTPEREKYKIKAHIEVLHGVL